MITFQEFIAKYTGQSVTFPNCAPNECMTLLHAYISEVYGLTDPAILATPLAYQVFTLFPQLNGNNYFTRIENTLTNVPNSGDIIIFDKDADGTGDAGHVCLFIRGDANNFTSFDSNWPTGSLPHLQTHTYLDSNGKGVLGWLTPAPQGTFVDTATFDQLVSKSTAFDSFVTAGYPSVDAINTKLKSFTDQIATLQSQLGEANSKNEELLGEVSNLQKLAAEASALPTPSADQGLTAIQQAKDLAYDLDLVASELQTTYPPVKNLTGEIQNIKNQLHAAQITLTKQAAINKANQMTKEASQKAGSVAVGFLATIKSWIFVQKNS